MRFGGSGHNIASEEEYMDMDGSGSNRDLMSSRYSSR
jgi:hypothetical protein